MEYTRIYCEVCASSIDYARCDAWSNSPVVNEVAKPCGHLLQKHSWQSLALLSRWASRFGVESRRKKKEEIEDEWGRLYCPTCKEEGRDRVVAWYVTDRIEYHHEDPYYVEGIYHNHSYDIRTKILCCIHGHKRTTIKQKGCANCSVGNNETRVTVVIDMELGEEMKDRGKPMDWSAILKTSE